MLGERPAGTISLCFCGIREHDTHCLQHFITHRTSFGLVPSLSFPTHQGREQMEVAPLVYPGVLCRQSLESSQSIGNKGFDSFLCVLRYCINYVFPRGNRLTTFGEYWIEEIHTVRASRLQRHEIQHPLLPSKFEIHTIDDEDVRPLGERLRYRRNERTQCAGKSCRDTHGLNTEVASLLLQCMTINEYACEQSFTVSRARASALSLTYSPGALAITTLSSPSAETPHRSVAAGRFRVSSCHTRQQCPKIKKISRNCSMKQ